jgi:hypothetical protein
MIPQTTIDRISHAIDSMSKNPNVNAWICQQIGDHASIVNYDGLKMFFLDEKAIGMSVCTFCGLSEVMFDVISTDSKKATWSAAVRMSYRCADLKNTMTIRNFYLTDATEHPGQYDLRAYCPHFKTFEAFYEEQAEGE